MCVGALIPLQRCSRCILQLQPTGGSNLLIKIFFRTRGNLFITNNQIKHQSFFYTEFKDQTILFLTIQFSINFLFPLSLNVRQFYSIQQGHSEPGSDGNEGVLHILQSASITRVSLTLFNVITGHSLGSAVKMQLVYSTSTADKTRK